MKKSKKIFKFTDRLDLDYLVRFLVHAHVKLPREEHGERLARRAYNLAHDLEMYADGLMPDSDDAGRPAASALADACDAVDAGNSIVLTNAEARAIVAARERLREELDGKLPSNT
jgi:hypothetical protein